MEGVKHYNFTGASGTGKTTILNLMRTFLPEYEFRTEVVRNLVKEKGIKINEQGTRETQELVFMAYLDFLILNKDKNYVSDRCIIDPLAYTILHVNARDIPREVLEYQWDIVRTMVKNGYLSKVYYFPIEFANVHDGVRSDDDDYRKETDAAIRGVLEGLKMYYPDKFDYITVHGTPTERINQILEKEVM